jgi:hypothetical protein
MSNTTLLYIDIGFYSKLFQISAVSVYRGVLAEIVPEFRNITAAIGHAWVATSCESGKGG